MKARALWPWIFWSTAVIGWAVMASSQEKQDGAQDYPPYGWCCRWRLRTRPWDGAMLAMTRGAHPLLWAGTLPLQPFSRRRRSRSNRFLEAWKWQGDWCHGAVDHILSAHCRTHGWGRRGNDVKFKAAPCCGGRVCFAAWTPWIASPGSTS